MRLTGLRRKVRVFKPGTRSGEKRQDLGTRTEVRWGMGGELRLGQRDHDHFVAVLATGRLPTFTLQGWILVRDGRVPEFASERFRGKWFVPPDRLRPMQDLPEDA